MATAKDRGARRAELLDLAGRIERHRATSADDLSRHDEGQALERRQSLYGSEVDEAISRRNRALAPHIRPIVSHDDLVGRIADAHKTLKPLPKHW